MHLYNRFIHCRDGIPDGDTRMGIGCWVYDQRVIGAFVNDVQYLSFAVKLHGFYVHAQFHGKSSDIPVDCIQ
jgi:hypothetical protein